MKALVPVLFLLMSAGLGIAAQKPLEIFFIDVEGGQATLFVTPSGQSLLVDTGWGYFAFRDADRIVKAAKMAKIKKIDYVVITHYHSDHVGGVPQLVAKIPVENFAQLHGESRETKYGASMEQVAAIVEKFCTFPVLEKVKLLRLTAFSFLTGKRGSAPQEFFHHPPRVQD